MHIPRNHGSGDSDIAEELLSDLSALELYLVEPIDAYWHWDGAKISWNIVDSSAW